MNIFSPWLKNTLIAIIIATIMILLFKYALKIEINVLRMVLVYIILSIIINLSWLIKKKNIKFWKIKYSIIIGIFCWGITTATLMNLFINNPFKLYYAIISYVLFMMGGFLWGITTYSVNKKLEKKKESNK
jgi:amino acid transporter